MALRPSPIYSCENGEANFISYADLEVIKAKSNELRGAVDISTRSFLFSVKVHTFQGFNSALQREHFNENYLEADKFPAATFQGKFIEEIDLSKEGNYEVRAKGILEVHGVKQERIIKGGIEVKDGILHIRSHFSVLLEDHNIKIPRVVYQKISPEIEINIDAVLRPVK